MSTMWFVFLCFVFLFTFSVILSILDRLFKMFKRICIFIFKKMKRGSERTMELIEEHLWI